MNDKRTCHQVKKMHSLTQRNWHKSASGMRDVTVRNQRRGASRYAIRAICVCTFPMGAKGCNSSFVAQ